MNEAVDLGTSFSAIVLFWLWWAVLSVMNVMAEISRSNDARQANAAAGGEAGEAGRDPVDPACRERIARIDPSFDAGRFIRGAERAYEMVLSAFAAGDLATLGRLLSPEVLAAFERAIAERKERRETLHLTFIGLTDARIVDVRQAEAGIAVSVRFSAEIVSATRGTDGEAVAGDPRRVVPADDLWIFEPDPAAQGRSWLVTATDGA